MFDMRISSISPLYRWLIASLLLFGLVYASVENQNRKLSSEQVLYTVQHKLDKMLAETSEAHRAFESLLQKERAAIVYRDLPAYPYIQTLVYKNGALAYWNGNAISPPFLVVRFGGGIRYYEENGSRYILHTKIYITPNANYVVVQLFRLYSRYPISNRYVTSGPNQDIFGKAAFFVGTNNAEGYRPILADGKVIFYASPRPGAYQYLSSLELLTLFGVVWLTCVGLVVLLQYSYRLLKRSKLSYKLLAFPLLLIVLRVLALLFEFPSGYINLLFFDARLFASSHLSPTLGDFTINLLCALVLLWYSVYVLKVASLRTMYLRNMRYAGIMVTLCFAALACIWIYELLYSSVSNSSINQDVSQSVRFSSIQLFSKLLFLPVAVVWYGCMQVAAYGLAICKPGNRELMICSVLVCALVVPSLYMFADWRWALLSGIGIILLLLIWRFRLFAEQSIVSFRSYIYFFMLGVSLSFIGGAATARAALNHELYDKKRFAEQLLSENDIITEFYLFDARNSIRNDAFIVNKFLYPRIRKDLIEGKIKRAHLPSHFSKYDLHLSIFDPAGMPLEGNEIKENYFQFVQWLRKKDNYTSFEDVFYLNHFESDKVKRYFTCFPIQIRDVLLGHVILELRVGAYNASNLYPELLMDERFSVGYRKSKFSYAVFRNRVFEKQSGDFDLDAKESARLLNDSTLTEQGVLYRQKHYYAAIGDDDLQLLLTSDFNPAFSFMANVSFYAFLWIVALFLILVISSAWYYSQGVPFNFTTRIQLYLNLYFLLPTLFLSIFTVFTLAREYKQDLVNGFRERAEVISADFAESVQDYLEGRISVLTLERQLQKIAGYNKCDVNLYNTSGKLLLSTEPLLLKYGLQSTLIHPKAYFSIIGTGSSYVVTNEKAARLNYYAVYLPLQSRVNKSVLGIVSIPFFESGDAYDKELTTAVNSLMILYTLVFLVLVSASFFVTGNLLQPIRLIGGILRRTSLEGKNLPLQWPVQDEIGKLVQEYNRMIGNLEESKQQLAKTEKESAWREMAQQVAHEIKNPLTPMKLKLQMLERGLQHTEGEASAKSKDTIRVLLEQVDTLDTIATSFYQFAKMPRPKSEIVEVRSVIKNTVELYNIHESHNVILHIPEKECLIMGDAKLMSQIVANLIINARQSVPANRVPLISVTLNIEENGSAHILVADNGVGIPASIRDKVFQPNFSTKFSGSGIGLALAKQGVEAAGGTIWFETQEGKGTTFHIQMPPAGA